MRKTISAYVVTYFLLFLLLSVIAANVFKQNMALYGMIGALVGVIIGLVVGLIKNRK
ncbi:hypothetical protein SDC9_104983 [bioreactor metagenome]|uniref:Uncharacterized protein n=1 Tax=bioreactor metagenome TaxID=1076179 RepID=A0A645B8Z8_9ZZZZ